MLIFLNSDGSIAGEETFPAVNQGSINANEIQLVAPFPAAVVTVAYTLPNGITLGPDIIDPLSSEVTEAGDYTMTKALDIPGYTVDGATLCVYTYKINSVLTARSGNLKIQFFVYVDGVCIATPAVILPINNGVDNLVLPPAAPGNVYEDIRGYVDEVNQLLLGVDENVANAAKTAINEATAQASAAEQSAEDASKAAGEASVSAGKAEEAANSASQTLRDIETKIATGDFDFLFTSLTDLVTNIDNIYGKVLIKGVTIDEALTFPNPDPTSIKEVGIVVFKDCTLAAPFVDEESETVVTPTMNLNGWSAFGLDFAEPYDDGMGETYYATCENGYIVSGCTGFGKIIGAQLLSDSDFNIADSCISVFNAMIGLDASKDIVKFIECTKVSNVTSYATETVYDNCHGLNNLDGTNIYIDCTYVDPFTCGGFIAQQNAVGKIPLFTDDGTFSAYDINADAETLRMINEGGIP